MTSEDIKHQLIINMAKHEDETLKEEDEIIPIVLLSSTLLTLASHLAFEYFVMNRLQKAW